LGNLRVSAIMLIKDSAKTCVRARHMSINVIGALIFMLLLKPFSQIVRRIADTIAASPRLTIAVTVIFHLIPASIIIYYALGAHL